MIIPLLSQYQMSICSFTHILIYNHPNIGYIYIYISQQISYIHQTSKYCFTIDEPLIYPIYIYTYICIHFTVSFFLTAQLWVVRQQGISACEKTSRWQEAAWLLELAQLLGDKIALNDLHKPFPYAPWCWNSSLQNWVISGVTVGQCYMEHLGFGFGVISYIDLHAAKSPQKIHC